MGEIALHGNRIRVPMENLQARIDVYHESCETGRGIDPGLPALPSGPSWLFHVNESEKCSIAELFPATERNGAEAVRLTREGLAGTRQ